MRPEPRPSVLSEPFWKAAALGELLLPRCQACGQRYFPPQSICPHCASAHIGWERSAGEGEIYSFTIVHRKPGEGFDAPFVLALVELRGGWRLMSHVAEAPIEHVRIGLPVRVRFDQAGSTVIPVFIPL